MRDSYLEILKKADGFESSQGAHNLFHAAEEVAGLATQVEREVLDRIHAGTEPDGQDVAIAYHLHKIALRLEHNHERDTGGEKVGSWTTTQRILDMIVYRLIPRN